MSIAADNSPRHPPFPIRLFTVEEYRRMGELGILGSDDAVELLAGCIVPKTIHNPLHDAAVEIVDSMLRPLVPIGWRIRIQSAITTSDSEPEPDLAIVRGDIRDHRTRHPGPHEVGLLIEVADSSVQRDRLKAELYARAGIANYWIVNLRESQVEVYAKPIPSKAEYQHLETISEGLVEVAINGQPIGKLSLKDLLP